MKTQEAILALFERTYRGKAIPRAAYSFLLSRGERERVLRQRGWGLFHFESVCLMELREVSVVEWEFWAGEKRHIGRRFRTPLGDIQEISVVDTVYGSRWIKEFLVKEPKDYKVLEYIIENTVFHPVFDVLQVIEENLGGDGTVLVHVERSPFQRLLLDFVGPEQLFIDLFERPDLVEEVLALLACKSKEEYAIAASSPFKVIHTWENVTEDMTSPRLFEKYCLPFYWEVGTMLHEKGKLFAVHLDGKLRHLRELIAETPVDVVESFTLPEAGGNLPVEKAQRAWPSKAIVANIPAYWCFQNRETIRQQLVATLWGVDRSRFMFCVSEDLPPLRMWSTLEDITDILDFLEREVEP